MILIFTGRIMRGPHKGKEFCGRIQRRPVFCGSDRFCCAKGVCCKQGQVCRFMPEFHEYHCINSM